MGLHSSHRTVEYRNKQLYIPFADPNSHLFSYIFPITVDFKLWTTISQKPLNLGPKFAQTWI